MTLRATIKLRAPNELPAVLQLEGTVGDLRRLLEDLEMATQTEVRGARRSYVGDDLAREIRNAIRRAEREFSGGEQ